MPIIDTKAAFAQAKKKIIFDDPSLLDRALGHTHDREARDTALKAVTAQLGDGEHKVTQYHIKQAISDLSDSGDYHQGEGDPKQAELCRKGFSALTQAYINVTNDVDVFRALPKARMLDKQFSPIAGATRPDPHALHRRQVSAGRMP